MQRAYTYFAGLLLALASPFASAQQLIESHDNWRVFTVQKGSQTVCYMASLPIKKEGNYSKRGDAYVIVTDRGGNRDEVSVSSGYPYLKNREVTLQFGQTKYPMFVDGERAWAYENQKNTPGDREIVKAMMRGSEMVVRGISWKKTTSKDTYSLNGFTAAHQAMKKACR